MPLAERTIRLPATAEELFDRFTTVEGLTSWMGVSAEVVPEIGGTLRWTHENGATMSGRFIELDRPTRLVFSYGWEGDLMGVPPEPTRVEITFVETEDGTTVSLVHRGIPTNSVDDHREGWDYFFDILRSQLAIPGDGTEV